MINNTKKGLLVRNSLGFDSNLFITQDKTMFNYSVDTIMLGNFVFLNRRIKNMLEIGTNNGALSIFIADRHKNLHIDAIEIQKRAANLAKQNVLDNNKQDQITVFHEDFNKFYKRWNKENQPRYHSIVCNPPFYPVEKSKISQKISKEMLIATHEYKLNLKQIIKGCATIIEQKGYLNFVLPVERMVDCFELLRKYKFEPKRVQFITPRIHDKPKLVLIESRYQTGWGLHMMPTLFLHDPNDLKNHDYLPQIKELYKPKKVK
ncbi:tRNA1(Val) (adenine(37)-N6)-methyltransferase [Mycoplasmopsis opalescens]|uniref:tRNA1(Val) (adenine(37)-N6)-methyltransferase n=1 Tax=Mycoplasmopsis opalescens TaxID=114886 RepID=UPI0004A75423|nr:tRNA1(Val) (adenine(37)-N6)-methyltransferase [Mycoplasmopsis opalescens]